MAINLDKLREKHLEMNKTGIQRNFMDSFLALKDGSQYIRILPWKDEDKEFYAETKIHRVKLADGNPKNFHCRKIHGEICPMCEAYFGLWKLSQDKDDEHANKAREIKPRDRFYLNVVDRETSEVKILSIGQILFKKIVATIMDPDYGDITDLENGHDFKIMKIMEGQWPKYDQSSPRPRPEPAGSEQDVAAWMDGLHDVHALVKVEDYEEMMHVAQSYLPSLAKGVDVEDDDDDYESNLEG